MKNAIDFSLPFFYNEKKFVIISSLGGRKDAAAKPTAGEQKPDRRQSGSRPEKPGHETKELLAQLQVRGVDLNASGLSKLEGQIRFVTDFELLALSDILNVSVYWLLTGEEK